MESALTALTGLTKIFDGVWIDREVSNGSTELWTHVADGGSIGDAQESYTGSVELDKLSNNADLAKILCDCQHKIGWSHQRIKSADELVTDDFRQQERNRLKESLLSFWLFVNFIPFTCPNMTASASIPPTPHPKTPNPLIIVVCESVPTTESGYKIFVPSFLLSAKTTRAKYSKLTWWTMPEPGGIISMLLKAFAPHFKNVKRSLFLSNSKSWFLANASEVPEKSTWIEWSMTRSDGHVGLILSGSPPSFSTASRIAAKSTTENESKS